MKILLSNKFYYNRGGDCIATLSLEKVLKEHGHEVAIFAMNCSSNFASEWDQYFAPEVSFSTKGVMGKINSIKRIFRPTDVKKQFVRLLNDFKPDIVHLNNIHSYLSPYIAELASERGFKVIWTQHDYKLICPTYLCLCNGQVCESCLKNPIHVLTKKCMKGSIPQSLCAYLEASYWNKDRLQKYVHTFIAPSDFLKNRMVKGGFQNNRIQTIPHCIPRDINDALFEKEDYYCFVGRLSIEKGVQTIINAAINLPYRLVIVGDGPLKHDLLCMIEGHSNISFVGFKQWDELKEIIGKARFLVTPSECYEVFGLVNIEAQALGTPVLGANIGGIPETITLHSSGSLFESGNVDDLKAKITMMFQREFDCKKIAAYTRQRYSTEEYYNSICKTYSDE